MALATIGGCTFITDSCACSPALYESYATGTVMDAAGVPVVGATVLLEGVPFHFVDVPVIRHVAGEPLLTDGEGRFAGRALGVFRDSVRLRAGIVRPSSRDTVLVPLGRGCWGCLRNGVPDTLRLPIRLP